jgi:hypothetical protein
MGWLLIMWAVIGSALLDTFVVPAGWKPFDFLPFLLTFIVPPLVALYVKFVYWK